MPPEILVIREPDRFSSILIEQNFPVINLPLIKTETLADLSDFENHLANIENFDGIFITSAKAAEIVVVNFGKAQKAFRGKFFVLGKRSMDLLKDFNCEVFHAEQATTAEELMQLIPQEELNNKRFLFPSGNRSLRIVSEKLGKFAEVVETIVYQTIVIELDEKKLIEIQEKFDGGKIKAVCFFSPSGVEAFLDNFEDFTQGKIKIAVIGQTTARFAEEKKLRVDFVSRIPAANDFACELISYLRK